LGSRNSGICLLAPFQEHNIGVLQAQENQACWLVPSVTHGTVGDLGPAFGGPPVSLVFQGAGSRSCTGESTELQIPLCAGKQDLLLSAVLVPGAV
jgi:hypothetical protein